jgi:sterol desaturase/sphingolipid hydroxylase (fatty acid hydroxylase superfamily)
MPSDAGLPLFLQGPVLVLLLVFAVLEWRWAKKHRRDIHHPKETLANLGIFVGMRLSKTLFLGYGAFLFALAADLQIASFDKTVGVFIVTFFAADFVYYLYHRAMHEVKALWCFHLVHHSSPWMNLTTAGRLNWLSPLISPFFYLPLVVIGLPGEFILASMGVNLLFQFFLHTEAIDRVPLVEGILNTPSAHRVHHASNARYLDKNYGGVLMLWDRLFGTYAVEEGPLVYGVTTGFQGHNPLWLVFGGFVDYARGRLGSKG